MSKISSTSISRRSSRRWVYPLMSLFVTLGLIGGNANISAAFNWRDLILPGIQVIQLTSLSDKQEVALGGQINDEILKQVQLNNDPEINNYVKQIGARLVPNCDRPNLPYTFQVVNDDSINAFATMGGYVYVHTGLLKAADTEAEVAGVMAHEIAHITNKHALKQMRQRIIAGGLADAAGVDNNVLVAVGVEVGLNLPKSRRDEYEADQNGLETIVRSGYAPSGMIEFFQKLLNAGGGSMPTLLRTHPHTEDRIANLEQMLQQARIDPNVGDGLNQDQYSASITNLR
jgi:beta-barrel assembly-enhancing protease